MGKLGVIMSTHNGSKKVLDAIDSILEQSYKDFKIIVCDDASTDNTLKLLNEKYRNNKKITIVRNNQSRGLSYALNLCLEQCKDCEYIARMDDDDYSYKNRLEEQILFLEKNEDISFVGCNVDIFDGNSIVNTRKMIEFPKKTDFLWNSPFIHPTVVFRYNALKKSDFYRVSKETLRGQDYDLFMRMYSKGFYGANIQKTLFRYTENNSTRKKRTLGVRLGECKVRIIGFYKMNILLVAFPFVLKPLIAYVKDKIELREEM